VTKKKIFYNNSTSAAGVWSNTGSGSKLATDSKIGMSTKVKSAYLSVCPFVFNGLSCNDASFSLFFHISCSKF
jgi:hypothetical protein